MKESKAARKETILILLLYILFSLIGIIITDFIIEVGFKNASFFEEIRDLKIYIYILVIGVFIYVFVFNRLIKTIELKNKYFKALFEVKNKNDELIELENRHYQLAYHDPLTGLMNKNKVIKKIDQMITDNKNFSILTINIDDYSMVNEVYGYVIADKTILSIKNELLKFIDAKKISKVADNKFVLLLNTNDKNVIINQSNEILDHLKHVSLIKKEILSQSFSAGISLYPSHGLNADELIKNSDFASGISKTKRKMEVVIFESCMQEQRLKESFINNEIANSITNNEFYVVYQPIYCFKQSKVKKLEALLRWKHPKLGNIAPSDFIYLAELSDNIINLTDFVFDKVINQISIWQDTNPEICISINVSVKALLEKDFFNKLEQKLLKYKVESKKIVIELTESLILEKGEEAFEIFDKLKKLGIVIALDDFGTGYSSLSYLKNLPVDIIKMDKSFITDLATVHATRYFLEFILDLCHKLDKRVVIEGVETLEQKEILLQYNVDYVQGYLYSKPLLKEQIDELIK